MRADGSSRLLAVDFSNLIVRHHHSPGGRDHDPDGRPLFGVCGAIRQVQTLLTRESPTHLLIARDGSRAENFRREISADYKAHRPDADEDLTRQFTLAYQALEILGWPVIARPAYEADDVIASAASQFPGHTLVISGDKDLLALCNDRVTVGLLRSGAGMERCGRDGCRQFMGVWPEQVRDYKALAGDSSDGIPGIAGVGPRSAVVLLDRYATLSAVYDELAAGRGLEGVRPHITRKIADGVQQARLSWRLAGMVQTLPVDTAALALDHARAADACAEELADLGLGPLLKHSAPTSTAQPTLADAFASL